MILFMYVCLVGNCCYNLCTHVCVHVFVDWLELFDFSKVTELQLFLSGHAGPTAIKPPVFANHTLVTLLPFLTSYHTCYSISISL